jgi:hypothetical protein
MGSVCVFVSQSKAIESVVDLACATDIVAGLCICMPVKVIERMEAMNPLARRKRFVRRLPLTRGYVLRNGTWLQLIDPQVFCNLPNFEVLEMFDRRIYRVALVFCDKI